MTSDALFSEDNNLPAHAYRRFPLWFGQGHILHLKKSQSVLQKDRESKTVRGIDRVSARTWMKERKRWNSTPLHSGCHTNAERRKRGGYSVLWLKRLLCSFSLFSPPAFNSDSRRVEAHSHHTLESRLRIDDNQRPAVHQTWLSGGCLYPDELLTTKSWQSNTSLD